MEELGDLLPGRILEALSRFGYRELNYVQVKSLELSRVYPNMLISAPTGAGKTEAAVLPVLRDLVENGGKPIYALYVTPLRALNRDIYDRMVELFRALGFEAEVRHGDTPQRVRRRIAESPPHMLITTPETAQFLLVDGRYREHLKNTRWVVVDEVHELLDDKRGAQLSLALERLRLLSPGLRVVGLSATLRDPEAALRLLSGGRVGTVVEWFERKAYELVVEDIDEEGDLAGRVKRVAELCRGGGVIVFTNTRDTAEFIGRVLARDYGLNVRVHHGSLSRQEREEAERLFKSGRVDAIVATSSLELGVDIGYARLVVQFGSPRQAIKLAQRVGRAGHSLSEVSRGVIVPLYLEDAVESAVLARRVYLRALERQGFHEKPLDVLSHQVAGLVLEYRDLDVYTVHEVVTRSAPFRDLSLGELRQLLEFLDSLGVVRFDGERVKMGRRTISYYYGSASMIPETLSFDVVDMASRRTIGALDYAFASLVDKGRVIILGGKAWTVEEVDVDANKVYVVENVEEFGEPPIWTGMTLPVDAKVAREVGSLYRRIGESLGNPEELEKLRKEYAIPEKAFEKLVRIIEEEKRLLGVVPSDRNAVVEVASYKGKTAITLHSYLGTKGNNLLALLLAHAVRGYTGSSARYFADPYRVLVVTEYEVPDQRVLESLRSGLEWSLRNLEEVVRESNSYALAFSHVASKMGVVDVKKSKPEPGLMSSLRKRMRGTPLDREALRTCLFEYFDLEAVEEFVREVSEGRRPLVFKRLPELSPLAQLIFEKPVVKAGALASELPVSSMVSAVVKRIENTHVLLYCVHCGNWHATMRVVEAKAYPSCPKCGSRALAVLRPYEEEKLPVLEKWRKGGKLSPEEKKFVEKVRQSASLVLSYGYPAVFVLAGHGIGPTTAKSILSKGTDPETLARNILVAEANYTRTRKYWEE